MMPHSPERQAYLTAWNRQHREKLRAMPLAQLKKLPPTVYTIAELHRRQVAAEVKKGLRPRSGPKRRLGI